MRTLGLAGPAADQNDQPCEQSLVLNNTPRVGKKVTTVATDDEPSLGLSVLEDPPVWSGDWQHIAQPQHIVPPMPQQSRGLIRHVVIEQEFHRVGSLICSATSASISVR